MGIRAELVAKQLTNMEKNFILGRYQPFGAHATVIAEHLKGVGIMEGYYRFSDFGLEMKEWLLLYEADLPPVEGL